MSMAKAYLLQGDSFVRYDTTRDAVDPGYPRALTSGWGGLDTIGFADGIDACLDLGQGRVYFFREDVYARFDTSTHRVDSGYPMSTALQWKGLADTGLDADLDAAANWHNGTALLFRGDVCVTWDIAADVATLASPIEDMFGGLAGVGFASDLDTVVTWPTGKAYFFRQEFYARVDMATMTMDAGYPRLIASGWPSLATAGFASRVSAGYLAMSPDIPAEIPAGSEDIPDEFFPGLRAVCAALACDPEDMLAVMMSESTARPGAQNPSTRATGLIQFMPATLRGLGWMGSPDEFVQLSAPEQLPFVQQYFTPFVQHGLGSSGRLYQAVFLPATLAQGSAPDTVVCAQNGPHGPLAIIVSQWFYDEVISHYPAAEPSLYRQVPAVSAWIRLPDERQSGFGGEDAEHGDGEMEVAAGGAGFEVGE